MRLPKHVTDRQIIIENLRTICDEDISIDSLIAEYGSGLRIKFERELYMDDPDYVFLIVYRNRLETDDEYNARVDSYREARRVVLDKKKKKARAKEEWERGEYNRLKAKFG